MPVKIRSVGRQTFATPPKPTNNQKRQQRYKNDPEYRAVVLGAARKKYRRSAQVELSSCLSSLTFFARMARNYRVVHSGTGREFDLMALSLVDTAKCLDKGYQTLSRWIASGMVPEPVLHAVGRTARLYSIEEVEILIRVIGNHETTMRYYRRDHVAVREDLFRQIADIRAQHLQEGR